MIRTKDICLAPVVGTWYEYQPQRNDLTDDIGFGSLENSEAQELFDLHYKWGQQVAAVLENNLKLATELHETVITIQRYTDFVSTHTNDSVSLVVPIGSGQECTLLLDGIAAALLLNRVTGGDGLEIKKQTEELTDLEQLIIGSALQDVLGAYQQQWLGTFGLNTEGVTMTAPRYRPLEMIKKESEVVNFLVSLKVGQNVATFEVLFTSATLEILHEKYKVLKSTQPRKITLYLSPEAITNVSVPVSVRIGSATVTMREMLALERGDVLLLNEKLNDSVFLTVAGETEFYGILGQKQGKYAAQIIEKKAKFYDIKMGDEEPVVAYQRPEPRVITPAVSRSPEPIIVERKVQEDIAAPIEPTMQPQPEQFTPVHEDDIKLHDPILDEITTQGPGKTDESDEFTWDLDDLKIKREAHIMAEGVILGENVAAEYNKLEMEELQAAPSGGKFTQDIFGNIPVEVTVVLGRTRVDLQKLLQLSRGDVVELNKRLGDAVDIMVNSQVIAQGEVVAVGENYGVKVTKVVAR